jgi:biopolymer transport protein ExbD
MPAGLFARSIVSRPDVTPLPINHVNWIRKRRTAMESDTNEPDLTPMLDVVFIMLIFFIVAATFVKEVGLDVPGKNAQPRDMSVDESLVLLLTSSDQFFIGNRQIDKRALKPQLSRLHAEKPNQSLVIQTSKQASTEALIFAMDTGNLVGLDVAIADAPN